MKRHHMPVYLLASIVAGLGSYMGFTSSPSSVDMLHHLNIQSNQALFMVTMFSLWLGLVSVIMLAFACICGTTEPSQ